MNMATERTSSPWPGRIVTIALLLAFGLTIARAQNSPPPPQVDAAADDEKAEDEIPDELRPHIIIAEHVILWDGEIVTWDEVLERLRKLRPRGPLHPTFHTTNGVHSKEEKDWQFWHDEVMGVYGELFQPAGVSFSSISPRGGRRYDKIRTADDLTPDPALARRGMVLMDGEPAADAQVVVLPLEDDPNVATMGVVLDGKRLRDPIDEEWVASDEAGRFTIHPTAETYFLAVLHDAGVVMLEQKLDDNDLKVQLEPWATITFSTTGDLPGQTDRLLSQSADLSIYPNGKTSKSPEFKIYEIRTEGKPVSIAVPPGDVVIRRSLDVGEGTSIGFPANELSIAPGAKHEVALDPASVEEELRAFELRRELEERRGGDR